MAPRAQHLFFRLVVAAFLFAGLSCNNSFRPHTLQFEDYRISPDKPRDTAMIVLMWPYADSVNKIMNGVIGIADKDLEKKQPESTLGNFMSDAMLLMAEKKFNTRVDAAFVNYGGI